MRRAAFALLALGLVAAATPAHAYRMIQNTATGRVTAGAQVDCNHAGGFTHWNIRAINWRHNTALQGANAATALQSAMASWTNVTDADHVLTYAGTTTAGWATDGQNTVLWANGNGCTGNCLALTALVLQAGQVIVESDVTFNNTGITWNTNGNDTDIQAVAAHEFGHSLGIHHTELNVSTKPTMYTPYFGTAGRSLETDDKSALQCSEWRYCVSRKVKGDGGYFAGMHIATLWWNGCLSGANVDIFKDGVKVLTTPNDGSQGYNQAAPQGTANYWVCDAGSTTWYNSATCTNVITLSHFAP